MEVHHHPHVEKKNFKEYLLEGLMIFLAVSMGFFAESIRENITRHEKEQHLMEMMIEDLKQDTAQASRNIKTYLDKVYELDTLRDDIIQASKKNVTSDDYRKMYYIFRAYGGTNLYYYPVERTLNILEKEGFGLIRKQNISDSILRQKRMNSVIAEQKELILKNQDNANAFAIQIFDIELLNDFLLNTDAKKILNSDKNFRLETNNASLLKRYAFYLFRTRSAMYNFTIFLQNSKKNAEKLILQIQKEYHLEKE